MSRKTSSRLNNSIWLVVLSVITGVILWQVNPSFLPWLKQVVEQVKQVTIMVLTILGCILVLCAVGYFALKYKRQIKRAWKKFIDLITGRRRNGIPKSVREDVKNRANNQCQWWFYKSNNRCPRICEPNRPLDIHHIDKNHINNGYSNLILLCPNHHRDAHANIVKMYMLQIWSRNEYYKLRRRH